MDATVPSTRRRTAPASRRLLLLAAAGAAVFIADRRTAHAQTTATWLGGTGNWFDNSRWDTATAPNSGTTSVIISGPSAQALLGYFGTATVNNLTIDVGQKVDGGALIISGNAIVNGTLSNSTLTFTGPTGPSLSGSGLVDIGISSIRGPDGALAPLNIGPALTIRGRGIISSAVNQGTIYTDAKSGTLTLTSVTNTGTLAAIGGGTLSLTNVRNAGLIRVDASSRVQFDASSFSNAGSLDLAPSARVELTQGLANQGKVLTIDQTSWTLSGGTVTGGTIRVLGAGSLTLQTPTHSVPHAIGLAGVTLDTGPSGFLVPDQQAFDVRGGLTLTTGSVIRLGSGTSRYGGFIDVSDRSGQTIGGNGEIVFSASGSSEIYLAPDRFVTFGPGVFIHGGSASIWKPDLLGGFINQGTIAADVPGTTIVLSSVVNDGTLATVPGSSFYSPLRLTQNAGVTIVNGTLLSASNAININAGLLVGTGKVIAYTDRTAATLTLAGTLAPGSVAAALNGIGTLTVAGNMTLTGSSHFAAELAGSNAADLLALSGTGGIGGNLTIAPGASLDLSRLDAPAAGNYVIATYDGTLTGAFSTVTPGYTVSYDTPHEIIVSAIPEPATATAMAAGALALTVRRSRKTRAT